MQDTELKEGLVIQDRYELVKYLGSGSFGEVWLGRDTQLDIEIAVKLYISLDKTAQDEFKNEYRVVYGLKEEHLLTADYYGVWEHRPFLTMKYCANGSAAKMAGKVDEAVVWQFIHDVAAGLKYLHGLEPPILHQDIKPENILADEQGRFLITDFGISRRMRSTMRKQSKRSVGSGALAYMGPERFLNEPMSVKASDIWSLGVSAYELATNELPFMGQGGGMLLGGAQLPDLDLNQWSADLNGVIHACMDKDTWARPTAEQLVTYSELILSGENESWHKWFKNVLKKEGIKAPKPSKSVKISNGGGHKKGGGGKTAGIVALVLFAVAILGGGAWYLVTHWDEIFPPKEVEIDKESIIADYSSLARECERNIEYSNINSYRYLIDARDELDSLGALADRHPFLATEAPDVDLDILNKDYEEKAATIYDAYYSRSNGMSLLDYKIEYLQIAGLVNPTDELKNTLNDLGHDMHTPIVFIAQRKATVKGNTLEIVYDGLNQQLINNASVNYTLTPASGSKITGRATVDIRPGRGNVISITLPSAPDENVGPWDLQLEKGQAHLPKITID